MPASSIAPDAGGLGPARPTALTRLWQVLRVVILVWLGLLAFLALSQRSMIYYPSQEDAAALASAAATRGFEPWKNPQGETIGYRSLPAPDGARPPLAVLITHGNAGFALHRADYATILRAAAPDRAVSVYLLEYPGYGARGGQPSQEAFLAAADEALACIPAGDPVVILGESIGTGVASATAAAHPDRVAGLLLLTPFDSLANVAQHHYPLLPVRWIMRDQYPSATWLKKYQGPVAVILAANDSIVPAKFGQSLFDAYAGPKKLITADQADHNDLLHTLLPEQWQQALTFLLSPAAR
jgi:pimeloyl-ACP methyl ester carboxylesterase